MPSAPRDSGQASVETVALLPLVALVGALLWQGLLVGQAAWLAGSAARGAARAQAVGADPRAAAAAALPERLRRGLVVRAGASDVRVRVRVPGGGRRWHGTRRVGPRAPAGAGAVRSRARRESAARRRSRSSRSCRSSSPSRWRWRRCSPPGRRASWPATPLRRARWRSCRAPTRSEAARAAAPSWSRERMEVRVSGRRVRVRASPARAVRAWRVAAGGDRGGGRGAVR